MAVGLEFGLESEKKTRERVIVEVGLGGSYRRKLRPVKRVLHCGICCLGHTLNLGGLGWTSGGHM